MNELLLLQSDVEDLRREVSLKATGANIHRLKTCVSTCDFALINAKRNLEKNNLVGYNEAIARCKKEISLIAKSLAGMLLC